MNNRRKQFEEIISKVKKILSANDLSVIGDLISTSVLFYFIRDWAIEKGIFEKSTPEKQFLKLQEEVGELAQSILKNNKEEQKDAIGDCVVVLTNLAHQLGFTIEDCIESAYNEIKDRKGKMVDGAFVKGK